VSAAPPYAGPHAAPSIRTVVVVGSGLIGGSVGLALRAQGVDVVLRDRDEHSAARAADLGAGRVGSLSAPADVCVLAVPPGAVARVLREVQAEGLALAYTDVSSVKAVPQAEVDASGAQASTFVGGHPIAGRERTGPGAARADLFEGRPWVLTPSARSSQAATARVARLVELCGAAAVIMDPDSHDRAMALVSHGPQLVASAVAARLAEADSGSVGLAGQGLRDVTRIAASDPDLWTGILAGNPGPVADVVEGVVADLARVASALRQLASTGGAGAEEAAAGRAVVRRLLSEGNAGRARVPGKHGAPVMKFAAVPVVVTDRPTQLARLFADAGVAGVNIEDVTIEHSPGSQVGLVELAVRPEDADRLTSALRVGGWTVHR
jgi:prephenate dehydrogenase